MVSPLLSEQTAEYLLICVLHIAHVAAEAVLIQLFLGYAVPETAGIRRNLIGKHDGAVRGFAVLQLEIDELYVESSDNSKVSG
jgi:hypothetical protein